MAQLGSHNTNTSVDLTNGSVTVIGNNTNWLTKVNPGDAFTAAGSGIVYDIAGVTSNTQLELSGPYQGDTKTEVEYTIHRDFTSPDNIPEINNGDIETGTILKRLARSVQSKVNALDVTGGVATSAPIFFSTTKGISETSDGEAFYVPNNSGELVLYSNNAGTAQEEARFVSLNVLQSQVDLAQDWASEDENVEVEAGEFSSKHYSIKSSDSAANAATSETNALDSASSAATSETNAVTSESNAATSETNAANSASAAATSESNAATFQNNAQTSATEAENAKNTTQSLFDQFGDQYLGAKTSDPSLDNDGNALNDGAVYFNTNEGFLKFYTGTQWIAPVDLATTAATNAQNSASNAATSETNASDSASNAATSETNAATSETNAATSASNAATSETNAATSETDAGEHEITAQRYANENEDVSVVNADTGVDTGTFSSLHHRNKSEDAQLAAETAESNAATSETNAATSETNAATSETNALNSENKAQQWADASLGTEVETNKFSARHWAEQLSANANTAYNWQGIWTSGTYNSGDAVFHNPSSSSYITLVTTTTEPKLDGSSDWQLLARAAQFENATFLDLDDTPISYPVGSAGEFLSINSSEDGITLKSLSDIGVVPETRSISTVSGLSGGGDLSQNLTLSWDGASITDSGAQITNATGIDFGSNLNVTDNFDGTITVDGSDNPPVDSVAGKTGAVTLDPTDVGLNNVPNEDATDMSNWDQTGATINQAPIWDGTQWIPQDVASLGDTIAIVRTPEIIFPSDTQTDVIINPTIQGSIFAPVYSVDQRGNRQIQVRKTGQTWTNSDFDTLQNQNDFTFLLDPNTDYETRIRDILTDGTQSDWSNVIGFTTSNTFIETPSITSPNDGATGILQPPTVQISAFNVVNGSDTQISETLRVKDNTGSVIWTKTINSSFGSITIDQGVLDFSVITYTLEVSQTGDVLGNSGFSTPITITTGDIFVEKPTVQNPIDGATGIQENPVIQGSGFNVINGTDTHISTSVRIKTV